MFLFVWIFLGLLGGSLYYIMDTLFITETLFKCPSIGYVVVLIILGPISILGGIICMVIGLLMLLLDSEFLRKPICDLWNKND